ncbi:MAG: hypothetical protein ACPGJF_03195 [Sinimarinibacterium flocculans]|uniref:hypothetical protein n=1 Tax=Sinimarinibacterium flocculans TaxID=985250 RepID=UPI003C54FDEE
MSLDHDIGEIKGMLNGVRQMISQQHEAVQRRIDDLQRAVERSLDEHRIEIQAATDKADQALRESAATREAVDHLKKQVGRRSALTGGGTGAIVAAGIELAKAALKGG